MTTRFILGILAYAVPTFILGYTWHLKLFAGYYNALKIYRADMIIPFGMAAMLLQGAFLSWIYPRVMAHPEAITSGVTFSLLVAVFAWTFTTLAVGAKHHMTSVPRFVVIETAFTFVQFAIVGPLLALSARA